MTTFIPQSRHTLNTWPYLFHHALNTSPGVFSPLIFTTSCIPSSETNCGKQIHFWPALNGSVSWTRWTYVPSNWNILIYSKNLLFHFWITTSNSKDNEVPHWCSQVRWALLEKVYHMQMKISHTLHLRANLGGNINPESVIRIAFNTNGKPFKRTQKQWFVSFSFRCNLNMFQDS